MQILYNYKKLRLKTKRYLIDRSLYEEKKLYII